MCDSTSITSSSDFKDLINCIKTNTDFTFYSFKETTYTDFLKIFKEKVYYDIFNNKLKTLYQSTGKVDDFYDNLLISFKIKSLLTLILLNSYKKMYDNDSIIIENNDIKRNGKLKNVSKNCYYTIVKVNDLLKFVKIVDYIFKESGLRDSSDIQDNIIYDIVNGYIFNNIMSRNQQYKKYCLRYECSFLSYYTKNDLSNPLYWNYGNILLNYEKFFINTNNITKFKNCCFVCISRYIENISLCDLFDNYKVKYQTHVELILTSEFINFFKFFSYMAFEYGFKHNDPHCGNILFDINNNNLVLIDYGRSIFSRYMNKENNSINTFLQKEMYKLNLNEDNSYYKYTKDIDSYAKLVNFDSSSYYYIEQSKAGDTRKKYYYMCIDELCQICMKFYKHFINYLNIIDKYNEIKSLTIDSIYLKYRSYTDYNDVFHDFSTSYNQLSKLESSHYLYEYRETLLLLNEGIYIFVLCGIALRVKNKKSLIDLIEDLLENVFNKGNYSIYQYNLKNFGYILYPEETSVSFEENYDDETFEDDENENKDENEGGFKKIKKIRKLKKYIYK